MPFCVCVCLRHPAAGVSFRQPLQFFQTAMLNLTVQQWTIMVTVLINFVNAPYWILVGTKALVYLTYSSFFSTYAWISNFYDIKGCSSLLGCAHSDQKAC